MYYIIDYPVYEDFGESTRRYSAILELTNAIAPSNTISSPDPRHLSYCWEYLALFWMNQPQLLGGVDYMSEALYHIRFQRFSKNVQETNQLRLVLLIEDELCRCGYAFKAWNGLEEFHEALSTLLYSRRGSLSWVPHTPDIHREYLNRKMIFRIFLKGHTPEQWTNIIDLDRAVYYYSVEGLMPYVENYEKAVCDLLPESSGQHDNWTDINYITEAIQAHYQIDLKKDPKGYTALFEIMMNRTSVPYCAVRLYKMKEFTPALATQIWGNDADLMIQRCFRKIYLKYKERKDVVSRTRYTQKAVIDSWMYRWVYDTRSSNPELLSRKTKDSLFRVSLGI